MKGLFDRDVILKLCCCNLWSEALHALEISQPFRLASTTSEKSYRKIIVKMLGDLDPSEALLRMGEIVKSVPVLSDEMVDGIAATDGFVELQGIDDIDGGEQILTAILLNDPHEKLVLTGDKRFISSFRKNLPDRWQEHGGSFISFEMCLLAIGAELGFEFVLEQTAPVKCCDGTLKMAIAGNPDVKSFEDALISYNPCN